MVLLYNKIMQHVKIRKGTMSERLLPHHSHRHTTEDQLWHLRWFFARLYAYALLLSIPSSVIIAIVTKNPLPGLIPTPLLLSMRPIIHWVFSQSPEMSQTIPARNKTKKIRSKLDAQSDALPPSG